MYQLEESYWWFVSRRKLIEEFIKILTIGKQYIVLDVGCGTGANTVMIQKYGKVIGLDISVNALEKARSRDIRDLVLGSALELPIRNESIDIIVATDVIEHLKDDTKALKEFYRVLKPNGHVIITVPAYNFLWSEHDIALGHYRRYTSNMIYRCAKNVGFKVIKLSYSFFLLFPLAVFMRILRKKVSNEPKALIPNIPYWLNVFLVKFQTLENSLLKYINFPFGLSIFIVLKK